MSRPGGQRWLIAGLLLLGLVATGCGSHVHHVVRPGDTLHSISFRYQQDFRDVARWNEIAPPYPLKPGQTLRVAPPREPSHGARLAAARAGSMTPPARTPRAPARAAPDAGAPAPRAPSGSIRWHRPVGGETGRKGEPSASGGALAFPGRRGEPVLAAAAGRVVYAGAGIPHYGNLLIIKHDEHFLSAYAHNERLLVDEGTIVRGGQPVAEMGDSGTGAQVVKLHFEIRRDGTPVDARQHLP